MPPAASIFETVELAPPDPILNTAAMYKADTHPQKVLAFNHVVCFCSAEWSFSYVVFVSVQQCTSLFHDFFDSDNSSNKQVNLGIGAYRTEEGVPWVLPVVRKAEGELLQELGTENDKEYAPIDGLPGMKKATQNLIFGKSDPRIASTQALSGTGALRIVGEFMARFLNYKKVYYSDPTWGNHPTIFEKSGMVAEKYPYWNAEKKSIRVKEWYC